MFYNRHKPTAPLQGGSGRGLPPPGRRSNGGSRQQGMSLKPLARAICPGLACPGHRIEYGQQLPHGRSCRNFMRLSGVNKPLVKLADHRIEADSSHNCHIQDCANIRTAAPSSPLASILSAVTIHRCDTNKRSYRPPIKLA